MGLNQQPLPDTPEAKAKRQGFLAGMYCEQENVPQTQAELEALNPHPKQDPCHDAWNEGFCINFT